MRLQVGCSGGALLDLHGKLIGLTSSLAGLHGGDTPGGFAIPIDAGMKRIIEVLKSGREVEYGFLGVGFEPAQERGDGVVLGSVAEGSPADRKGLKAKDVILAIEGIPVHDGDDLFLALGTQLADTPVKLKVLGQGQRSALGRGDTRQVFRAGQEDCHGPGTAAVLSRLARRLYQRIGADNRS